MVRKKVPALLVIMSIVLIISGIVSLLLNLLPLIAGMGLAGLGISAGSGILASVGIAVVILALLSGVLQILMGVFGMRGSHLTFCLVMAIIVVVLCLSEMFMGADALRFPPWISLSISALYLLGVIVAIQQEE